MSTISRQVARGQIPTVRHGRRLIDPEEADRARARNLDPLSLWGGSASCTRSGADAPCREEHGYAPGVMPLLVGLRADGPGFVRRLMLSGSSGK
jgi:hypothetical protein